MNTPNTVMLKIGVWLQTMTLPVYVYTGPTLPDAFRGLLKKIQSASPLELQNKERLAMGYAPLTNSEWLAANQPVIAQDDDNSLFTGLSNDEDIFRDFDPHYYYESSNLNNDDFYAID